MASYSISFEIQSNITGSGFHVFLTRFVRKTQFFLKKSLVPTSHYTAKPVGCVRDCYSAKTTRHAAVLYVYKLHCVSVTRDIIFMSSIVNEYNTYFSYVMRFRNTYSWCTGSIHAVRANTQNATQEIGALEIAGVRYLFCESFEPAADDGRTTWTLWYYARAG